MRGQGEREEVAARRRAGRKEKGEAAMVEVRSTGSCGRKKECPVKRGRKDKGKRKGRKGKKGGKRKKEGVEGPLRETQKTEEGGCKMPGGRNRKGHGETLGFADQRC